MKFIKVCKKYMLLFLIISLLGNEIIKINAKFVDNYAPIGIVIILGICAIKTWKNYQEGKKLKIEAVDDSVSDKEELNKVKNIKEKIKNFSIFLKDDDLICGEKREPYKKEILEEMLLKVKSLLHYFNLNEKYKKELETFKISYQKDGMLCSDLTLVQFKEKLEKNIVQKLLEELKENKFFYKNEFFYTKEMLDPKIDFTIEQYFKELENLKKQFQELKNNKNEYEFKILTEASESFNKNYKVDEILENIDKAIKKIKKIEVLKNENLFELNIFNLNYELEFNSKKDFILSIENKIDSSKQEIERILKNFINFDLNKKKAFDLKFNLKIKYFNNNKKKEFDIKISIESFYKILKAEQIIVVKNKFMSVFVLQILKLLFEFQNTKDLFNYKINNIVLFYKDDVNENFKIMTCSEFLKYYLGNINNEKFGSLEINKILFDINFIKIIIKEIFDIFLKKIEQKENVKSFEKIIYEKDGKINFCSKYFNFKLFYIFSKFFEMLNNYKNNKSVFKENLNYENCYYLKETFEKLFLFFKKVFLSDNKNQFVDDSNFNYEPIFIKDYNKFFYYNLDSFLKNDFKLIKRLLEDFFKENNVIKDIFSTTLICNILESENIKDDNEISKYFEKLIEIFTDQNQALFLNLLLLFNFNKYEKDFFNIFEDKNSFNATNKNNKIIKQKIQQAEQKIEETEIIKIKENLCNKFYESVELINK